MVNFSLPFPLRFLYLNLKPKLLKTLLIIERPPFDDEIYNNYISFCFFWIRLIADYFFQIWMLRIFDFSNYLMPRIYLVVLGPLDIYHFFFSQPFSVYSLDRLSFSFNFFLYQLYLLLGLSQITRSANTLHDYVTITENLIRIFEAHFIDESINILLTISLWSRVRQEIQFKNSCWIS